MFFNNVKMQNLRPIHTRHFGTILQYCNKKISKKIQIQNPPTLSFRCVLQYLCTVLYCSISDRRNSVVQCRVKYLCVRILKPRSWTLRFRKQKSKIRILSHRFLNPVAKQILDLHLQIFFNSDSNIQILSSKFLKPQILKFLRPNLKNLIRGLNLRRGSNRFHFHLNRCSIKTGFRKILNL